MTIVNRLCVKDFRLQIGDKLFFLTEGSTYITSEVNRAIAGYGPKPVKDHVIVFSNYWVYVHIDHFETIKSGE